MSKQQPIINMLTEIEIAHAVIAANRTQIAERFGIKNLMDEPIINGLNRTFREDFSDPTLYTHEKVAWGINTNVYKMSDGFLPEVPATEDAQENEGLVAIWLEPLWNRGVMVLMILDRSKEL